MRWILTCLILLIGTPALAWEARGGQICELTHEEAAGEVRLTYDPAVPEYSITITPASPWRGGDVFAMRFNGPRGLTIATRRHAMEPDGSSLTVTDRGFGNVLDGLEFNATATALLGDRVVTFGLEGAAPEVQAFRDCASGAFV